MSIRFLYLLLLLLPLPAMAGWTGIAVFVGQHETDWLLSGVNRQANIDFYGLRIEERSSAGLRVGITAGQMDLRLLSLTDTTLAEKYNGEFISLYFRLPVKISKNVKLHSHIEYQLNQGVKAQDLDNTEINWTEVSVDAGVSVRLGSLSLRPFIQYRSIDGDITSSAASEIFKQDESVSQGLMLDFHVEHTAFVRLTASSGSQQSLSISFAREY